MVAVVVCMVAVVFSSGGWLRWRWRGDGELGSVAVVLWRRTGGGARAVGGGRLMKTGGSGRVRRSVARRSGRGGWPGQLSGGDAAHCRGE